MTSRESSWRQQLTTDRYRPPVDPLGNNPGDTISDLQTDAFKELINKFSWVLGSTYRKPYSNKGSAARKYALMMAMAVIRDNGYPEHLAKI